LTDGFVIRADCRHYRGDRPCRPGKVCQGCADHVPLGERILIVKLAAVGDVIRTTPLLTALRARHPSCWITWVTDPDSRLLLRGNPLIDELLTCTFADLLPLAAREFDRAIVLDKEPRAAALGSLVRARDKAGFGIDSSGRLVSLNPGSDYALRLGLDDDLKFRRNTLTYPAIVFGMCGLPYRGEEYVLTLDERAARAGTDALRRAGWVPGRVTAGLNTGCGEIFATKKWTEEGFAALAEKLAGRGIQVVLLGGPGERERNRRLKERLGSRVVDAGCDHPLDTFAGVVAACDVLVTADTLALHLAIGYRREVVLLMGPTAKAEIDLFGRGEILDAGLPCAPCYRRDCPEGTGACMVALDPAHVLEAVLRRVDRLGPAEGK
jgi:ADP-heptose:LPS heptosyltransferase